MNFKPDDRKTTYRIFQQEKRVPPKIIFSSVALKWIRALLDAHTSEVGWYAIVDELEENTYFIHDVFYPKHDLVTGGTCETSAEGEHDIMNYLIDHERVDDIPKLRFWGHYHPMNFSEPSSQDEHQAMERMQQTQSYLIRAICTDTEMSVSFFDFNNQVRFDNIKWVVQEEESAAIIEAKLAESLSILSEENTDEPCVKANNILALLLEDTEMAAIRTKVAILKKENLPEPAPSYVGRHNQQTNLFGKRNRSKVVATDSDTMPFGEHDDDEELMTPYELSGLMSDVDKEVTSYLEFQRE